MAAYDHHWRDQWLSQFNSCNRSSPTPAEKPAFLFPASTQQWASTRSSPLALLAAAVGLYAGGRGAWVWQASEYGKQLAEQAAGYVQQLADRDRVHGREREEAAAAALEQLAEQKTQRKDLEDRLQEQGQTHWKEMNDAQQIQARLRDRLATADLRLSVLVDAGAFAAPGCDGGVREAAGTGSMVHGPIRAQLDPAHAQRIIGITDTGDRGLIALQACQAYVREVTK